MKRAISILLLVLLALGCASCKKDTDSIKADVLNNNYTYKPVDYSSMSDEEYQKRWVFDAVNMYNNEIRKEDKFADTSGEKYGVKYVSERGGSLQIGSVDDLCVVLTNDDFKNKLSIYQIDPILKYYLPTYLSLDIVDIQFLMLTQHYYFNIEGCEFKDDKNIYWAVIDAPVRESVYDSLMYFTKLDGLTLNTGNNKNGDTVYYFSGKNGPAFFETMGIMNADLHTAYVWEQDGVIGVIILPGEHKAENLDLCVLEKHEL